VHIEQHGTVADFAQVQAGTALRFGWQDRSYLGLKTTTIVPEPRVEPTFACAVLAPGHPSLQGQPGMLNAGDAEAYPIFVLPELRFLVSQDEADWVFRSGYNPAPGDVLISAARTMLIVADSSVTDIVPVDIATGELVRGHRALSILVRRWSLVITEFGKPKVLFEYQPSGP
jgi:hypothetical protein